MCSVKPLIWFGGPQGFLSIVAVGQLEAQIVFRRCVNKGLQCKTLSSHTRRGVPAWVIPQIFVGVFISRQVYTVGPDYAHAEARKSPALDGKVERDSEGKEVRYPVMLSAMEKLVARKVCLAFKVCAVDTLGVLQFSGFLSWSMNHVLICCRCSKQCAALTFCGPMDTPTCAMSTVSVLWRTRWSTTMTVPRSSGTTFSSFLFSGVHRLVLMWWWSLRFSAGILWCVNWLRSFRFLGLSLLRLKTSPLFPPLQGPCES